MNITIDSEVLLRALLKGDMMDSVVVTEEFASVLSEQEANGGEAYNPWHLEPAELYNKKGYILWSKAGWENELKRRAYLDGLPESVLDYQYKPKEKRTKETITKELLAASMKGDLELAKNLSAELKGLG